MYLITPPPPQPQSLSRADSGIVFTGSRAETPEPVEEEEVSSAHVENELSGGKAHVENELSAHVENGSRGEEDATVGGKVVSLSAEGGGDVDRLRAIPEEALGVGSDQGNKC